jgi:hypothetical protein
MGKLAMILKKSQRVGAGPDQHIQIGGHPGEETENSG